MPWPFSVREPMGTAQQQLGERAAARAGIRNPGRTQALTHSAVWACRRLRADLISSMPVDVFRQVGDLQLGVPTPPVLTNVDGSGLMLPEYIYASQNDLDDFGNAVSIITARDGLGLPAALQPVDMTTVTVRVRNQVTTYNIGGTIYKPSEVFHERQFPVSGSPVGLSPLACAAMSISGYLSAQQFAADWFSGNAVPNAILKNTKKKLEPDEANVMKSRFKASMQNGDIFVTGADWDYSMVAAQSASASFLEEMSAGLADVCRFYGVPGDMIDAETSKKSITYANVTQRNLQLLTINIGPAVTRRESKLSQLTPKPRFVKFNRNALLAMDVAGRYASYQTAINSRVMAPSEARALENRAPFTPEQEAEFARLFPTKAPVTFAPSPSGGSDL